MKFSEYLKGGKKSAITNYEADVFGIELSKGWKKRYADVIITEEMLKKVYDYFLSKPEKSPAQKRAQARVYKIVKATVVYEKKLVYVMKNSRGEMKIGISIDPIKRARQLTTGSGTNTVCLAAWEVEDDAKKIESFLLKAFQDSRLEGEWFKSTAFSVQDVENKIPCNFRLAYQGKDLYFKKGLADTEDYEYLHIKHETEKALLFNILGHHIWVAKSMIKCLDRSKHLVTVPIGIISERLSNP